MSCRCNLAGVLLQLMALGIPDVMNFDFMSKPSPGATPSIIKEFPSSVCVCVLTTVLFIPEAVCAAVRQLELLGAVERKEQQVLLTSLGKKMASFPLEPRYAKVPLA